MLTQINRLVEPAKILLVVGIAYSMAISVWYFFAPPQVPASQQTAGAQAAPKADLNQLMAQHLFGQAGIAPTSTARVTEAPDTQLRLTLEGIFQADNPEQSAAIVAEQNRQGELYLVGGRLPGNAILAEVLSDRIILRRGSVFETLRFSDEPVMGGRNGAASLPAYDPGPVDMPEPDYQEQVFEDPQEVEDYSLESRIDMPEEDPQASVQETVRLFQERLGQDPEGTLQELGVSPVAEGSSAGYRLGALAQNPYLRQVGLQPGDVVLSVNGRPVGNVQQDQMELERIMAQGSARLEIQRGGRRFFVTASIQ